MALSPPVLGVLDTAREAFTEAQEEALQHLVVALNWLTLGQTSFPPESARKGFPMSQQQMDMLDYLDGLVDHFLRAGEVSSESLGRKRLYPNTRLFPSYTRLFHPTHIFPRPLAYSYEADESVVGHVSREWAQELQATEC